MRFLIDECTGPIVARWLREQGHDAASVYEDARGSSDDEVIDRAFREGRVLVTNDKDFGGKVYRERRQHAGIVLLRLEDERSGPAIDALARLLSTYADGIAGHFVVVTDTLVRFAQPPDA